MTQNEDPRLVELLYGELSATEARAFEEELAQDPRAREELDANERLLGTLRALDEEPPAHLDALILAHAREAAASTRSEGEARGWRGWLRRVLGSPLAGVAVAGGLAAVVAVVLVPTAMVMKASREGSPPAMLGPAEHSAAARPADTAPPVELAPAGAAKEEVAAAEPEAGELEGERKGAAANEQLRDGTRALSAPKPAPPPPPREERVAAPGRDARLARDVPAQDPPRAGAGLGIREVEGGLGLDELAAAPVAGAERSSAAPPATVGAARAAKKDAVRRGPESAGAGGSAAASPEPGPSGHPADPQGGGSGLGSPQRAPAEGDRAPPAESTRSPAKRPSAAPAGATVDDAADSAVLDHAAAARLARDLIRAAEQSLELGDEASARRTLATALARTRGTPSFGDVALRLARLDLERGRYADAIRHGRAAAVTPRFRGRDEALDVVDRAAGALDSSADRAWVEAERAR